MAIDSAAKRYAFMNFGQSSPRVVFEPDGAVDDDDRRFLLSLYLAFATPPTHLYSMLAFGRIPSPLVFEPNDGVVNASNRAMMLHLYSGNELAAPSTPGQLIILLQRNLQGGLQ